MEEVDNGMLAVVTKVMGNQVMASQEVTPERLGVSFRLIVKEIRFVSSSAKAHLALAKNLVLMAALTRANCAWDLTPTSLAP